ncbi:hypothetical protein P171DRAFT_371973 [Karstenula rhodostoma CBS 690.94]|uniref:Uncharacterized protein n=1 Tax=Karstenula rhodostoma CBS 690.94 TaxID=1392251 RepID=A0A9P4U6X7_9PLEO|nr:hypothetical protein P171DRAFT_371973 [Karstenula rhodostoma CBS 690.94]
MAINLRSGLFIILALALRAAASTCAIMVTETVYVTATCAPGECASATAGSTNVGLISSVLASSTAPDNFHELTPTPNHGSIKNSCNYEVYVDSIGCGKGAKQQLIPAGQTWSEPLRSCPAEQGTVVYKVSKADAPSKPVQFEVGLSIEPGMENSVWYDISFLDCMRPNTTDLSGCPGWEGGVQCVPGKQGCQVFVCGAGEYCDGSTYTVPEFGIIVSGKYRNDDWRVKAGSPVTSCATRQEGIAFELCAAT